MLSLTMIMMVNTAYFLDISNTDTQTHKHILICSGKINRSFPMQPEVVCVKYLFFNKFVFLDTLKLFVNFVFSWSWCNNERSCSCCLHTISAHQFRLWIPSTSTNSNDTPSSSPPPLPPPSQPPLAWVCGILFFCIYVITISLFYTFTTIARA